MISKRVPISRGNDNYGRLARYITGAGHAGEKCLLCWCEGMLGGNDYVEGIDEVKDVQARNTRAANKTYHLIVSFRPEDEAKLTPKTFKSIETRFAAALGYAEHQRHCGVHQNTANLHMHIAYNMIHPEKYTCHKEFRDFWIRDKVCRELEREFSLRIDHGIAQRASDQIRNNEKARAIEAHTGQQSFESYARSHKEAILSQLEVATSWQDIHAALASCGMEIKPHGNGLVIRDRHTNRSAHTMKASALNRNLSKQQLVNRFGLYQPPLNLDRVLEQARYRSEPLHRSPERGQLFAKYRAEIEARKAALKSIKEQGKATIAGIHTKWNNKLLEFEHMAIAKKNRRRLLSLARKHKAEALAKARLSIQETRKTVRQKIPFTCWNEFLQHKAEQGNKVAVAVLRSRYEAMTQKQIITTSTNRLQRNIELASNKAEQLAELATKDRKILEQEGISLKGKKRLQAVLRMEKVLYENNFGNSSVRHRVDGKGVLVFFSQDGVRICDTGSNIYFSTQSRTAKKIALLYAQKKWGDNFRQIKNHIIKDSLQNKNNILYF